MAGAAYVFSASIAAGLGIFAVSPSLATSRSSTLRPRRKRHEETASKAAKRCEAALGAAQWLKVDFKTERKEPHKVSPCEQIMQSELIVADY